METGQIILRKKITPSLSRVVIETRIRKVTWPWRLGAMFGDRGGFQTVKNNLWHVSLAFVSRPGMRVKVILEIPLPHLHRSLGKALPVECTKA